MATEEAKKRKRSSFAGDSPSRVAADSLRPLLDPLRKDQLVDLILNLTTKYPTVAEDIAEYASADPVHRKLFVRGLSWETTSETLCAVFSAHGEIEEGAVIGDKVTGKSRGYGFITYRHLESTQKALQEPTKLIDGRLAVCTLAHEGFNSVPAPADVALRKIYIGGLSPDTSTETLLNLFSMHGDIEEGSVAYDKETNKSRGFGFVTYRTAESAKRAIDDPNKTLDGRTITVKYADASKNKFMQSQMQAGMFPFPGHVGAGYQQYGKPHAMGAAPGYAAYAQNMMAYQAVYPSDMSPYPSYYSNVGMKESAGLSGGYPYYGSKQ